MPSTPSEASTDTSDDEPLLEIMAIAIPHRRPCHWLRFTWFLLSSRLPMCIQVLGRTQVYGRARLAANILGLGISDALQWIHAFPRCASPFMVAVPRSGIVNGYTWVDPEDYEGELPLVWQTDAERR